MEIERKFLVNELPAKIKIGQGKPIMQGYLMVESDREIRVRRIGKKHFLASKNGSGVAREENEIPLNQTQFELLWPASTGRRIEKERHVVRIANELQAELDVYRGFLSGLQLVEVEFPEMEHAMQFKSPGWFGPEVTDDSQFSNRNLACYNPTNLPEDLRNVLGETNHSVGAVPIMQINGMNHFIVISTRTNNRWIFPKGNPKTGMKDEKVALKEAFEEAGVAGELYGSPIPVHYWKGYLHYIIDYYPMLVSNLHPRWDEQPERQRRICTFEEATGLLNDVGFVEAMQHSVKALHPPAFSMSLT